MLCKTYRNYFQKGKSMVSVLSKLFGNSSRSISNWKKEGRPVIKLVEQYFTKEDLEEFMSTGKIANFDIAKEITTKIDEIFHTDGFYDFPKNSLGDSGDIVYKKTLLPKFYQYVCNKNHGVFLIDSSSVKDIFFDFVSNNEFDEFDDSLKIYYLKFLNNIDGFAFKLLVFRYSHCTVH